MKTILLIVANGSRARLFRVRHGQLERLETLAHPESRARTGELVSDRPGRTHDDDASTPHRSGMGSAEDAQDHEALLFARELARRVAIQARRGRDPEILIFAPPRFLGRVKSALDTTVAKRVVASVSHDYTAKDDGELIDVLQTLGVRVGLATPV